MNKLSPMLLAAAMAAGLSACHVSDDISSLSEVSPNPDEVYLKSQPYDFEGNGKAKDAPFLEELYTKTSLSEFNLPEINQELLRGLKRQLRVLKYKRKNRDFQQENLEFGHEQLKSTIEQLIDLAETNSLELDDILDAYQIAGEDQKGNVHFTGYYTPILKVSREKTATYKYPLYTKPKDWSGPLPSRKEIDFEQVLKGKGLELAYASNIIDIYFMQVQGSGIVEYPDGKRELFAFSSGNGHSYRSIGRYMVMKGYTTPDRVSLKSIRKFFDRQPELLEEVLAANPSYVFFQPTKSSPKGAGLVPLTSEYSVAVDTDYIPMGSCLLARVPIVNNRNKVIRHEFRVLLAQDIGAAINGPGHVDLYTGVGPEGQAKASALHHYGNLWLLLPKAEDRTLAAK